jgi:hypothetical protein
MRAVVRRIDRLEDQFGSANGKPRSRLRMMISMAGAKPSLEDATCRRTLWSDGTLFEMVEFHKHNAGPEKGKSISLFTYTPRYYLQ